MTDLQINYWAVLAGGVLAMAWGMVWYGPLFGKKWMEIVGADAEDLARRKEMQKSAGKLYVVQFILTLFQVLVLAHLVADTARAGGIERAFWVWAAFVMPTVAGSAMWNNDPGKVKWARFLIQSGYQLCIFIMFGALLQFWK